MKYIPEPRTEPKYEDAECNLCGKLYNIDKCDIDNDTRTYCDDCWNNFYRKDNIIQKEEQ